MITDGECGVERDAARIPPLRDALGRELEYLRLSVTERCNFRCRYCLPDGCPKSADAVPPLSVTEIGRLARAFARLGFWKIRLTGGEPTIRRDILEIVARIAATPGIERVGMTTNGWRLKAIARDLADAGLTCLNVSCDSLDAGRFAALTGVDRLSHVLDGIDAAVAAGIPRVKVNAVLLRDTCAELDRFLDWIRERPVSVRFIELMKTGDGSGFFAENHVTGAELARRLLERGFTELPRTRGAGPSVNYGHPGYRGHVGLIAPYGRSFCATCNRLRVSATGDL
ncbi:MAG TPA: GTP 3',8-cyclase MoaA, partial [Anaeromyxobacteraceae bacterium]|nr:GTP 3',8-cyclase MoaA [Anaeromyxobacteraceae bacterium]